MRLQRPVVAAHRWLGHCWPRRLRVAPGSRLRIECDGPSNDNAWPVGERVPPIATLFGMPADADPYAAMRALHRERRRG